MPSSEQHIRKAEYWLSQVEAHMPTSYREGLPLMAVAGQIHAMLAVVKAIRESHGG